MVTITHEQNIIYNETEEDQITFLAGNVWHLVLLALGSALKKKAFDDKHL